jgi:hypothetical protein
MESAIERIRREHPRAYKPWTVEEDRQLTERFGGGMTIEELTRTHERQPGGIRSRLRKLALIDEKPRRRGD